MSNYYEYEDVKIAMYHALQKKEGWKLYGYKADESDMTQEEKEVVKEFDGCEANYNQILNNNKYYLVSRKNLLEMKS